MEKRTHLWAIHTDQDLPEDIGHLWITTEAFSIVQAAVKAKDYIADNLPKWGTWDIVKIKYQGYIDA